MWMVRCLKGSGSELKLCGLMFVRENSHVRPTFLTVSEGLRCCLMCVPPLLSPVLHPSWAATSLPAVASE